MRLNNSELNEAMEILGLVPEDFKAVKQARDINEAREVLRLLKDKARRGFRRAALKIHPDHGGDEALFKRVNAVLEHIVGLELRPAPRPVPMRRSVMHVVFRGAPFASTTASTTSTTTAGWGPGTVYTVVI